MTQMSDLLFGELDGVVQPHSSQPIGTVPNESWLPVLDEVYHVLSQEPSALKQAVTQVDAAVGSSLSFLRKQKDRIKALAQLLSHYHRFYVRVRTGLGADNVNDCMAALRHTFMKVQLEQRGPEVLVDPYFRDQFRLGFHDEMYETFLEDVPEVFVGTRRMLQVVVHAVTRELEVALSRHGVQLPPWREQGNVLSKWMPTNYRDELYPPPNDDSPASSNSGGLLGLTLGSARRLPQSRLQGGSSQRGMAVAAAAPAPAPALPGQQDSSSVVPSSVTVHLSGAAAKAAATVKRRREVVKPVKCSPKTVVMGFNECALLPRGGAGAGGSGSSMPAGKPPRPPSRSHHSRRAADGAGDGDDWDSGSSSDFLSSSDHEDDSGMEDGTAYPAAGPCRPATATAATSIAATSGTPVSRPRPKFGEALGGLSELFRPAAKRALQRDTAPKALSVVSSCSSKNSSTCGKSPQRYRTLDHLLPAIRTVKLGA